MSSPAPADWWAPLYDDIVAEALLVRKDQRELDLTVSFLRERLGLAAGSAVFDQCCGVGSLSEPLARSGARVVGVDQCAAYIDRARTATAGLDAVFHVGDAREFTPPEPADAAVNWGTSFGNADEDGNRAMLRRAFETLRPGGRFALDYQHVPRVLRTFQPARLHRLPDETLIVRESEIDLPQGTLNQRWTFLLPGGERRVRHSRVRLYLPHELAALARACGFADPTFYGGIAGEPLSLDSPRCILIVRRPE